MNRLSDPEIDELIEQSDEWGNPTSAQKVGILRALYELKERRSGQGEVQPQWQALALKLRDAVRTSRDDDSANYHRIPDTTAFMRCAADDLVGAILSLVTPTEPQCQETPVSDINPSSMSESAGTSEGEETHA